MKDAIKALFDKNTENDVLAIKEILDMLLNYIFNSFIAKEVE